MVESRRELSAGTDDRLVSGSDTGPGGPPGAGAGFDVHRQAPHIMKDLGFGVEVAGDELRGRAAVVPELAVPGTGVLRASILAAWTDTIAGVRAAGVLAPQVPVTLGLDLHLDRPPAGLSAVSARTRTLKAGRSVVVVEVELHGDDAPLGVATVSFMAAPAPPFELPSMAELAEATSIGHRRLREPVARRARCERREPGVAAIPLAADGLNASMTMNGGLLALVAEEAALSARPDRTLSSISLHYLRPVRVGPAVARAVAGAHLVRVEVLDAGADDRLAVVVTAGVAFER